MKYLKLFEEIKFYNSIDEDNPVKNNYLICFSKDEKYEIKGYTHGKLSHAIKHLIELEEDFVNSILLDAIRIAKASPNIVFRDIKNNINDTKIANNNSIQFLRKAMLNTFDMINDKIKNDIKLSEDEKKIRPLLYELQTEYDKIIEGYEKNAIDIDNIDDAVEIKSLIDQKKILKFTATYNGYVNIYYLNFENSALISKHNGIYYTMFKIDKSNAGIERVKSYINKQMIIKNEALKKALDT